MFAFFDSIFEGSSKRSIEFDKKTFSRAGGRRGENALDLNLSRGQELGSSIEKLALWRKGR